MRGLGVRACRMGTVLLSAGLLLVTSSGYAQQPAPAPSAPVAASAPDVVLLKGGGMLRGTISELVPGEYVVIVTVTGKERRLGMDEVAYAGPAASMPAQPAEPAPEAPRPVEAQASPSDTPRPFVTVRGAEARLQLRSTPHATTFHLRRSAAVAGGVEARGYEELCTTPCEITMPEGTYSFAMSVPKKRPVEAEPVTIPPGASTVTGEYTDKSGTRAAGWAVLGIGTAVGLVVAMVGMMHTEKQCTSSTYGDDLCLDEPKPDTTLMVIGSLTSLGSLGVGLTLGLQHDEARVTVGPSAEARPASRRLAAAGASLGLVGHF